VPARANGNETGRAGGVLRDVVGEGEYAYQVVVKIGGLRKFELKKKYLSPMASVLTDPRQKAVYMAPVLKQPRHKTGSMASGDNRGQKVYL